jgi:hypothetical protein
MHARLQACNFSNWCGSQDKCRCRRTCWSWDVSEISRQSNIFVSHSFWYLVYNKRDVLLHAWPYKRPYERSVSYHEVCASALRKSLIFKKNDHMNIEVYYDSDWASRQDDKRFTSGYCMFVGGNLVSWQSKKQLVVVRSTT